MRPGPELDLLVIGGGTAGLTAAVIAGGLGARTVLVERERTGGECLWTGCVPSKALLEAADVAHRMRHADRLGLPPVDPEVDLAAVMAHVRAAQKAIEPHDAPERVRRAGADVVHDHAVFTGDRRVRLVHAGHELTARAVIVAVGSAPVVPPVPGLAEAGPLTTDTVWELDELPARLLVLGGGPVACELGQAFARLGSHVTLVEQQPRLLPTEDTEASALLTDRLRAEDVDVRTGATVTRVDPDGGAWRVTVDQVTVDQVTVDRVLVATGRRPRTDGLDLDRTGVRRAADGTILVNRRLRTSARGVYAAGDVNGLLPFTSAAAYQAGLATLNALFLLPARVNHRAVPTAVFTDPEIAQVGLREAEARARWGRRVTVARLDHRDLDRAVVAGRTDGFTKLVAAPGGRLVGATVVGAHAAESMTELAALVARRARIWSLYQSTRAYPVHTQSAADAVGEHLQATLLTNRTRRLTRPLLGVLRRLTRPR